MVFGDSIGINADNEIAVGAFEHSSGQSRVYIFRYVFLLTQLFEMANVRLSVCLYVALWNGEKWRSLVFVEMKLFDDWWFSQILFGFRCLSILDMYLYDMYLYEILSLDHVF